ncbi:hypothetical protein [Roseateles sp.]|uniref:hypothetical protein n=1 Tax=Roseateles sp. TaxID=1971397 RepID=UPI003263B8E9
MNWSIELAGMAFRKRPTSDRPRRAISTLGTLKGTANRIVRRLHRRQAFCTVASSGDESAMHSPCL